MPGAASVKKLAEESAVDKLNKHGKIFSETEALLWLTGFLAALVTAALLFSLSGGGSYSLKYFWSNDTDIPSERITLNFSPAHIFWFASIPVFAAAALAAYRRKSAPERKSILQTLAAVMLLSEIAVRIWQAVIGHYTLRNTLPLHLCSISIFIEFLAVFREKDSLLKEFSYSLSMPAALAAIITPGWRFPFVSFSYLQSVAAHSLLVLIPVLIVWGDGFRPDFRRLPKCFLLLLFLAGAAGTGNALFGANYMFLAYVPKDTALQVFERWFGHPGYIFLEAGLIFIIWAILYLPWIAAERKRKQSSASESTVKGNTKL